MKKIDEFNDECPDHGGEIKKEYTFGMNDADVITFFGCNCALVSTESSWMNGFRLFPSYTEASGAATLQTASNSARY